MTRVLGANGVNMHAFTVAGNADFGILHMIVSDVELAVRVLKEAHFTVKVTEVLYFTCPDTPGDWYFTGNYPTPGGNLVVCRSFVNYVEKKNVRAY